VNESENKVNGVDLKKLKMAITASKEKLKAPQDLRKKAVKELVGMHYSDGSNEKRVPVNMIEMATNIYTHQLAARAPRVMVSTANPSLRPYAVNMALALNQIPEEIGLEATVRRAVVEALFSFGIVKVGLAASGEIHHGVDVGEAYVDVVELDDYFVDMTAHSRNEIQFEGNDYWLDIDVANEIFKTKLKADEQTNVDEETGQERVGAITRDESMSVYKDRVQLRDIWLPKSNQLVTIAVTADQVLQVVDWDGPIDGPYHILGFADVPGQVLPLPPVAAQMDLHELGNNLFRKIAKQANDKKSIVAFQGGDDEQANRVKNAADGEGINFKGQKPEKIDIGGVDQVGLAVFLQVKDMFSYFNGNLDALGGLSPSSDTASQDEQIAQAASARIANMKREVLKFAQGIFEKLAWYEWTNPVRERVIQKPVKGTDITIKRKWSAETRDGDFLDYNFDIDVYSMQDDSPQGKIQKISQFLNQFAFPLMPMLEQQGVQIDIQQLTKLFGDFSNIPELEDIIKFQQPPEEGQVFGNPNPQTEGGNNNPQTNFKPPVTKRTYERVNRPGATRSGKDQAMSMALMGKGVQQSEMESIGRPIG